MSIVETITIFVLLALIAATYLLREIASANNRARRAEARADVAETAAESAESRSKIAAEYASLRLEIALEYQASGWNRAEEMARAADHWQAVASNATNALARVEAVIADGEREAAQETDADRLTMLNGLVDRLRDHAAKMDSEVSK